MEEKNVSVKRRAYVGLMKCLMWFSAGLTCLLVLFLIGYVLYKGLPNITWELLSTSPSYLADSIGILPDLMNTLYLSWCRWGWAQRYTSPSMPQTNGW